MDFKTVQLNILEVWANTPIKHIYDAPDEEEIVELSVQDAAVELNHGPNLLAFNGYYRAGRDGTASQVYTRLAVYNRIKTLCHLIAPHISVSVFDAFRTLETQAELFAEFHEIIRKDNPTWLPEQIHARTLEFVADPKQSPAHNTGGAIDLSLFDKTSGEPLDFGTQIDEISDWSYTDYFETHTHTELNLPELEWKSIRRNRRILFNGMKSLGFINLTSEWWHYDLGNGNWAEHHKCSPIFRSMEANIESKKNRQL